MALKPLNASNHPGLKFAKGKSRKVLKAQRTGERRTVRQSVRAYVFGREHGVCRCCQFRPAETLHEIVFRSVGGRIDVDNSIAVCGDGVRGCHGLLQRHEIVVFGNTAEALLRFHPQSEAARRWLRPTASR